MPCDEYLNIIVQVLDDGIAISALLEFNVFNVHAKAMSQWNNKPVRKMFIFLSVLIVIKAARTRSFIMEIEGKNSTDLNITSGENTLAATEPFVSTSVRFTLYGICIILIVVGNLMVIIAVFLDPKLRKSPTNTLIVSLAVSDLLVGSYYIPSLMLWEEATHLMVNKFICTIDGFIQLTSTGASVFSLIAIASDRFRAIVTPFKPKITRTQATVMILVAWTCAMCYASYIPVIYGYQSYVMVIDNETVVSYYCYWKPGYDLGVFRTVDIVVLFLLPLIILCGLYVPMVYKLRFGAQPVSTTGNKKKRAIKMLSMVVILFFLMWLPYYVFYLLAIYGDIRNANINVRAYALVAMFLNYSNSFVNPIIYACFNDNFRNAYKNAILCRLWKSSIRIFPTTEGDSSQTNPARNVDQIYNMPSRNTLLTTAANTTTASSVMSHPSHSPPSFIPTKYVHSEA
ncbi:QRFP-like peptide receptor [Glandiceps talaboti]